MNARTALLISALMATVGCSSGSSGGGSVAAGATAPGGATTPSAPSAGTSTAPPSAGTPPATFPPSQGWTAFTESADTAKVYVSSSQGDDANSGASEQEAVRTLARGISLLRDGRPDWLLLRRGDTWSGERFGVWTRSGRSASEPMLVGSYGASPARPRVQTGARHGFRTEGTPVSHLSVVGVHFEASGHTGSETDVGGGLAGVRWMGAGQDVLFEDCMFERYGTNFTIHKVYPGTLSDFRVRRCVLVDAFRVQGNGHSQGLYASGVDGLLIEECVFDHNGWSETVTGAVATMFNHNTYINSDDVVMRGNLFLRAASMGNKFRSDVTGDFTNLTLEDNLYVEGEIGVGVGGNTNDPLRFQNVTIRGNVFMHIGRTRPTGRSFAWYLGVTDVDGALVEENYFLHQPLFDNSFGISLGGGSGRNQTIQRNTFYGVRGRALRVDAQSSWQNILVANNTVQDPVTQSRLVDHSGTFGPVSYQSNTYSSGAPSSGWFRVDGADHSHSQWQAASGEQGSAATAVLYVDPSRDVGTYQASLGGTATFEAFVAEARSQSQANWRSEYTAGAVNAYVKAGFRPR
jgi:hypothetical protein